MKEQFSVHAKCVFLLLFVNWSNFHYFYFILFLAVELRFQVNPQSRDEEKAEQSVAFSSCGHKEYINSNKKYFESFHLDSLWGYLWHFFVFFSPLLFSFFSLQKIIIYSLCWYMKYCRTEEIKHKNFYYLLFALWCFRCWYFHSRCISFSLPFKYFYKIMFVFITSFI